MKQTDLLKKLCITTITLIAVLFYGCDISDSNKSNVTEELSEEELEVAGQIIAESLSDQKDGIFASLNDAFSLPSSTNLTSSSVEKGKYASAVFNTAMAKNNESTANNYSYEYDPGSGTHFVNFNRSVNDDDFFKETTAELEYIYYDADGNYIYSPRLDSDLIESIEYNGTRSGSIETPNKTSSYERVDQFLISGLNSGGAIIIENGLHEGSGQFKVTRENGDEIERNYTLTVEFLDVQINSQTLSDGSLQKSVEGALAYEMMISKNLNGDESMKTVNGTIEFNGDGTALLRFQNILDDFKVTLEQGNIIADNEFEGYVESVDTESDPQQFTLSDENTYLFGTDTEIDSEGDLLTLADVQRVMDAGIRVEAEGTFAENTDGARILQSVKFEYEDDDLEFEDTVSEASEEDNTFTLENGTIFDLTDETVFDPEGDLGSLSDLLWALDNEYTVEAEGEFMLGEDGSNDVTTVKFEYDEDEFEFDDDISSVDSENNSFTLENGETYIINEETRFHERSDLNSFEELATAISEGDEVEGEGEYLPQADGSRIVKSVKFETEEDDDEGDEDGDDDGEDHDETDFSGIVESADASANTFTLRSGMVIQINEDTEFDDGIQSIENLIGALDREDKVSVEGEYYTDSDDNKIALELEFDIDRRDDDSDDGEEDRDEFEFEGQVESADPSAKTFQVDGVTFHVNGDSEFKGDLNSLGNLNGALQRGDDVEVEGEYYTDSESRNIITEVEFDAERRDDDDDEDGDDDGDDEDEDDEDREEFDFEGSVSSATSTTFTIGSTTYTVNDDSEIEGNDGVSTLQDVIDAINDGDEVEAEGEYYVDGEDNIVIEVEFEVEREDEDDDGDSDDEENEFGGRINSVNVSGNSIELMNGRTYVLNGDTEFDDDSDLFSLQDVADDLADGFVVTTEGIYEPQSDGTNLVLTIKFESNRDDDDDGDDDGDDEDEDDEDRDEFDFEGSVSSATSTTFTLDGETFTVNNATEIEGDDVNSMQDVIDAINNGDEVEAEGEYYVDSGDNIVIEVEFDIERRDDDEDGDDGDDDSDDEDEDDEDREEFDFEGSISSATSTTFMLDGQTFTVNDGTEIEGDDVNSMQDVIDAINNGNEVEAEGEYYVDAGDNIVIEVEFDIERRDDDDDDDGDDGDDDSDDEDEDDEDREEFDFEGSVSSATSTTFTLDGETYTVNDGTEIEGDDVNSMQDVINAIDNGDEVEAEGEYYVDSGDNIVIEVEFDIERRDDDDDDGDDDGDENGDEDGGDGGDNDDEDDDDEEDDDDDEEDDDEDDDDDDEEDDD